MIQELIKELSPKEQEKILNLQIKLRDRDWRLDNLYYIKDKKGNKIKFHLNYFQKILKNNIWYLTIVLKARQLGISTFFSILYLDAVLFKKNQSAAIIAHKQKDAQVIFEDKVKFAFDNLPNWLKSGLEIKTDSREEMTFRNGSKISVTVSTRSGTVQYLHISELGYTAMKFPEKAKEIISGAINSVEQGGMISIESTARGKSGIFWELCEQAIRNKKEKVKLSPLDFKFFFFPWWKNPEYKLNAKRVISKELQDYFDELMMKERIILSQEQKQWYLAKKMTQKDDMKQEYPSTPDEAFEASVEGSYYKKQVTKAWDEKRFRNVPHATNVPCNTWWDLGMDDTNVILITQQIGSEIRFIDCIYNEGEGLAYYVKQLQNKPYIYDIHYLPHDAKVRELGTGKTRVEQLREMGLRNIRVVPKLSIEDGIEMVRSLFNRFYIDNTKCSILIDALTNYRKEWDDKLGVFKSYPVHDKWSHFADAVRVLGIGLQEMVSYDEPAEEFDKFKSINQF